MVNFENLLFTEMEQLQEELDFKSFSIQVVDDYRRAFFFKKMIDNFQLRSFYRQELLLAVLSKLSNATDLIYNLPFSFAFNGKKENFLNQANKGNLIVQGREIAESRDFVQNVSVISGMVLANQQGGNNDFVVFAGLSVAGMTEIDFLKLMELLSESKLRTNIILLDIHKAKGDFLKVRDYFEPKSEHSLKTLVVDVADYQSVYQTLSEGVAIGRATGVPVIFYPVEKLITQVEYFNEETDPLKKIRSWMLINKITDEAKLVDLEKEINNFVVK